MILLLLLSTFRIVCAFDIAINTWSGVFETATQGAYNALKNGKTSIDAVEIGCSVCESNQCDGSVGFGNHADTSMHTSLDALIMDGNTMDVGSVGFLKKYRTAISVARLIMDYTDHTLLVGEGAEDFVDMLGVLTPQSPTVASTIDAYNTWVDLNCQPNFYRNLPGCEDRCGPYHVNTSRSSSHNQQLRISQHKSLHKSWASSDNHDTIGMVVLSSNHMSCGTTTNGANHKVAGRVGDSPIVGSGCYVDSSVGGAAGTGDGDVMMRFSPAFAAVSHMSQGVSPTVACQLALKPIALHFPSFSGGLVCLNKAGEYGAASYNMTFSFSVASDNYPVTIAVNVDPL